MKLTTSALAAAGMVGMAANALPQTSEFCEVVVTSTMFETATSTVSVPASYDRAVPTYTSTVEITSSVVVTVRHDEGKTPFCAILLTLIR